MEPINIFSRKIDPRGIVALLRSLDPSVQVTGPEDDWKEATIKLRRTVWRKPLKLTFRHDSHYYDGDDWPRQILGMRNYFSRFPDTPRKPAVLRLIDTFRFALATNWQPDLNPDGDARLAILFAVARHLDGVLFSPSSLRDAEGRLLLSADGEDDPDAVLPTIPPINTVASAPNEEAVKEEEAEPEPPSPERVVRRALALAAVTGRALLEQDDPAQEWVPLFYQGTLAWVEGLGIGNELEPDEWEVLQRPPGRLDLRAQTNATWRLEGLVVLAWALQRFELPPYDRLVHPQALIRSLSVPDIEPARELLADPTLRTAEELKTLRHQLFSLHWRLRNYSLEPKAMDFETFARECWFGPLDIRPYKLIGGDLALGDYAIHDAPDDLFRTALSATMERHQAINWLTTGGLYSATDTST